MSLRLISKASCLGVFGSAAYATTIIDIDVPDNSSNKSFSPKISDTQKRGFTTTDENKMTLEDVEMFENSRGCKLIFTDRFGNSKSYTVREWFNEKMKSDPSKKSYWRSHFVSAVKYNNQSCSKDKVVVFEPNQYNNFAPKAKF